VDSSHYELFHDSFDPDPYLITINDNFHIYLDFIQLLQLERRF